MQNQVVAAYGLITCRLLHHPFVFREGDGVKCITYNYGVVLGTVNR
jgi:hypothetical protein